jgi:hypothetical protein
MKNDVRIDFQLLGTTISPKEISKITGITPSVELMRGERNGKLDLPRQNIWSIESQVNSDDVVDHWNSLAAVLINSKDKFKEIAKTGSAKLTLVINSSQRVPSITIPPSMSEFAGFVNAVIDIDHLQQ